MTRAASEDNLKRLYDELMPALAKAAVGDFQSDLNIDASHDPRVNEIVMGVQVLLDVINDKVDELEKANSQSEPRDRSVTLLDEVLRRSID